MSLVDPLEPIDPLEVVDEVAELAGIDDLDDLEPAEPEHAMAILRRGIAASPELRAGVKSSIGLALVAAVGKLIVPISIRQIIDHGLVGGFRPGFVYGTTAIAAVAVVVVAWLNRVTYIRLVHAAQHTLYGLRVRTFSHVHRLSLAHHTESKRGVLVTRVTSDIVTLAQFAQWGAISWIVNSTIVVVTLAVMAFYSWQLALVTIACFVPVIPAMRFLQRRQLAAYDWQRTAVAATLGEVSESVMGAGVIRAYAMRPLVRRRVLAAINDQYRANMRAALFFSLMFALSDIVGAVAVGAVIGVGVWWGPDWGMTEGTVVACLFLANILLTPIGEIGEVLDQTQTALAGWRKVLDLLDTPVDVVEAQPGDVLPAGALDVRVDHVEFAYGVGDPVLRDVDLAIAAGTSVAIVGETGSGKTTLAKLLCRLADPTSGRILVGGRDLREISASSRATAIRLVPQDGFLFDTSIAENVRLGRPDATDGEVRRAFDDLDLGWWLAKFPDGLDTRVGERGEALSVGERQLVALARAQLADSGLLLLDEATSAVDAETERALSEALIRLSEGRTTISVAHRLSTAEAADLVVVFD
ncbi:MAG TPA: ABC transporter ATP-binding protein, partial [Microthrixaceae bacterium]|nr:ABC transporter ATP-binding protein [Microthrixaceae bacterium]